jgi:hypothetical protein
MAKGAAQTGRKLLRSATDELGLTTPKTARRRTPVAVRKKATARPARGPRR